MYDVLPVIPNDTDFVTAAIAETKTIGSIWAQVAPLRNWSELWPGYESCIPYVSAKNMPVIFPFSANLASQM